MRPISICLISKNEERNIHKCINSVKPLISYIHNSEIVVVDTGSTDRTIEIAEELGAKVYSYEWDNDFSSARNFAAQKAGNDLVLSLDCDEYLLGYTNADLEEFISSYEANSASIGMLSIINVIDDENEIQREKINVARLYDKRLYRFYGRIHENIRPMDWDEGQNIKEIRFYRLPLIFEHAGYESKETRIKKAKRNLSLLMDEYKEKPIDPYIMYQIGKCNVALSDLKEAISYYEAGISKIEDYDLSYVKHMLVSYGYALMDTGNAKKAILLEEYIDAYSDYADYLFMMGLVYMNNFEFNKAIETFRSTLKASEYSIEGTNSYKSLYNIGVIYEVLGDIERAKKYYIECGEYSPALSRLANI